jgi:hypothetical protein
MEWKSADRRSSAATAGRAAGGNDDDIDDVARGRCDW